MNRTGLAAALALLVSSSPARAEPVDWATQRAAWEALRARMVPLARAGAVMPTPKLERAFHREGVWFVPTFQPTALPEPARALLAAGGPAAAAAAHGPAGRAVGSGPRRSPWRVAGARPRPRGAGSAAPWPRPLRPGRRAPRSASSCGSARTTT
jgi:hypothetical protein